MENLNQQHRRTDNVEMKPNTFYGESLCDGNDQLTVDLERSKKKSRFGFSIAGGREYSRPITVGRIEIHGCANLDGRLKLNDIILHVNKTDFANISQKDARALFKSAGKHVTMHIQRMVPQITEENSVVNRTRRDPASTVHHSRSNDNERTQPFHPSMRSRANSHSITNKPVHEYEVGTYEDLSSRNARRGNLEVYHLISPKVAPMIIPDYNERKAICITLRTSKHHQILNTSKNQPILPLFDYDAKQALAHVIGCNIEPRSIPTSVLLEAIDLHCRNFPLIYVEPNKRPVGEKINTTRCNVKELVARIPYMRSGFLGELEDVLIYGNCVKDLPEDVYYFLTEKKFKYQSGSGNNENLRGKYVVHREMNLLTDQARSITITIELNVTEMNEEKSNDYIRTNKTFSCGVSIGYE